MGEKSGFSKYFKTCSDRKKCMFLGALTVFLCLGAAYSFYLSDEEYRTVTSVDGVYYDNNPWTKAE